MHATIREGARVETVRSAKEATDWAAEVLRARRWGVLGRVIKEHASHGLCFSVQHEDGSIAVYESHEIVACCENVDYTPAEREEMLQRMTACANAYYMHITGAGCHAMIEFSGLMNEYIQMCRKAHARGEQFPRANTHSGDVLPCEPYNATYLAEKLNCIYGPALLASEANRDAFIAELFGGTFKLVPVR